MRKILCLIVALLVAVPAMHAQFKTEAFTNGSKASSNGVSPSDTASLFSFKEYFRGISHQQEIKIGTMVGGSAIFVGGNQIYNKDYWKLPVIYAGLGATIGGGIHYKNIYNKSLDKYNAAIALDPETTLSPDKDARNISRILFAGAALTYWGAAMDGVISYKVDGPHHAGKATMYSLLMPGLGQAYNGEYWKIPLYWGALSTSYYFYNHNNVNYHRFKRIYNEATAEGSVYTGKISAETALYYRNVYRRMRDYSVLAIAVSYLIQVIDANVFSFMQNFEVNEDLSMNIRPTLFTDDYQFAFSGTSNTSFGFTLGINF